MTRVPNKFPTILGNYPYKLAIVGEAPGADEVSQGIPFVGQSGRLLTQLMNKSNILREACFIGNVCQVRPPDNDLSAFEWTGDEIQSGRKQLEADLLAFKPNLVLCLGSAALHLFKAGNVPPARKKKDNTFIWLNSIGDWRGSLFESTLGFKSLASFHPAYCLRNFESTQVLLFDMLKAKQNAGCAMLSLPQRELIVEQTTDEICQRLESVLARKCEIAIDIEGGIDTMSCISIADSPTTAFIIPFTKSDGSNYYATEDEEYRIWRLLATVLANPDIPKILQNSLYDRFVLQYSYSIVVRGVVGDTMLAHWELYCELEKSLGFQCSLYTDEQFYKSERKSDDLHTFWRYCCRDSAVTKEIHDKQLAQLSGASLAHYKLNLLLLNPMLYMELRGIRYDKPLARKRLKQCLDHIYVLQAKLDELAHVGFSGQDKATIIKACREVMCFKRDQETPKKDYEEDYATVLKLCTSEGELSLRDIGYLNTVSGNSLNVKSKEFKDYLYTTLGLPPQRNKLTHAITTDDKALLNLQKKQPTKEVELAINIQELRTRSQTLNIHADKDGRIRCGYNIVGTVTGRISSYTSPTGSGYNMQTIPDDYTTFPEGHPLRTGMRDLFLADEDHWMFQCDLKGSDGWTIGAHLAKLGDSSMLDDLRYGIKPASRICYMLRHGNDSLRGKQRDEVALLLKEITKDSWDYFACKVGIWGICYLMGPDLLSEEISSESYGKVNMSRKEVSAFRDAVFAGYRVGLWHTWMARKLAQSPTITAASGHTRRFYGRSTEILGNALSHEPQANTTFATNLAMYRLWTDPANKLVAEPLPTMLRIEPLHQVHDALIGQFKKADAAWATSKITSYFSNTLQIAGYDITIPFEGNYGESWGSLKAGTI